MAVLRQDVLENLLETRLRELGVRVEWRHELSALKDGPEYVTAKVDKYEKESRGYVIARSEWVVTKSSDIDYRFVVGADGYKSRVRHALNTGFPEVGPAAYYAVFEFASSSKLENEMRLVFGEGTTDVLWPLPDGGCRWSFQLPDYTDVEAEQLKDYLAASGTGHVPTKRTKDRSLVSHWEHMAVLEESNLRALLAERAPWFAGSIDDLRWATVIRFERRLADTFGSGRMWLAGDSAHLTGPAGIQSMNLGLFEAHDLGVRIARILRDGVPLSELAEYNRKWTGVWRQLHGLDSVLQAQAGSDPWVAEHGGQLLSCLPAHGEELTRLASQLKLDTVATAKV
jgi:2-polyprenyl-6-methoxyphenol hydroxylase-like FAD-dependent oxidoreductase